MKIKSIIVALLLLSPLALAGDKPKHKVHESPKLEEGLKRAVEKARSIEGMQFLRATVTMTEQTEITNYLVYIEYQTGEIGIYECNLEPEKDQFIIVEKPQVNLLREGCSRCLGQ